ncbi:hypothetical protein KPL74_10625 [Bacillus sp. NP157]|nr:hypothetical protein KPL74_10625 [Bacillus sp. NP157]
MLPTIGDIRRAVSQDDMYRLVGLYEQVSLGPAVTPDECLDLLIEAISFPELLNKKHFDVFLSNALHEATRFSPTHMRKLYSAMGEAFHSIVTHDVSWVVSDFIATRFSATLSARFFSAVAMNATRQGFEGIALGVDVLRRRTDIAEADLRALEKLLRR